MTIQFVQGIKNLLDGPDQATKSSDSSTVSCEPVVDSGEPSQSYGIRPWNTEFLPGSGSFGGRPIYALLPEITGSVQGTDEKENAREV